MWNQKKKKKEQNKDRLIEAEIKLVVARRVCFRRWIKTVKRTESVIL